MNILSKFNRICFNYSCRLSSNEHAAAFVDEVRQMIQEHEQPSPAPVWQPIAKAPTMGEEILIKDDDGNCVVAFWDVHPDKSIYETDTDEDAQEKYTWVMANGSKHFYAVEFEPTCWTPAPPQADEAGCPHCDDGSVYLDGPSGLHPHECGTCNGTGKAAEVTG